MDTAEKSRREAQLPRRHLSIVLPALFAAVAMAAEGSGPANAGIEALDVWRPTFHFSPERNWINDPNGLVYLDGEYHLFYQYNPFGDRWGHMSWGHARSTDLLHWQELPVAIPEDQSYSIFSGSVVFDRADTSGFGQPGKPPLVALYTGARRDESAIQNQQLAYSLDRGTTWRKYSGNPVLDLNVRSFRDPKVFWYAPDHRWIMVTVLSDEHRVAFFGSADLKHWERLGTFGPTGAVDGAWECPDLLVLPVTNAPGETRWVLKVDVFRSRVALGSGAQFFVGRFDGHTFVEEPHRAEDPALTATSSPLAGAASIDARPRPAEFASAKGAAAAADYAPPVGYTRATGFSQREAAAPTATPARMAADIAAAHTVDFGRDFYAAESWSNLPANAGRHVWIAWMNSHDYAKDIPTSPFRGTMTLPREVSLRKIDGDYELVQAPVKELAALREEHRRLENIRMTDPAGVELAAEFPKSSEIEATLGSGDAGEFGLMVRAGSHEKTVIGYEVGSHRLFVDRTRSGRVDFNESFPGRQYAPLDLVNGALTLHVILDASSVEVFAGDGTRVFTEQIFPDAGSVGLRAYARGGTAMLQHADLWRIAVGQR